MDQIPKQLILPRPGDVSLSTQSLRAVAAPPEAEFVAVFGKLMPPAQFVDFMSGKAAYYELLPDVSTGESAPPEPPSRVLLVHGVQTPAIGLLPLAQTLTKAFPSVHFVLFDLCGHGLSDTPVMPYNADLFHQLIDALMNQLQWPSAHLVGFSFGASVSVGYASSRPDRVNSIALIAPAGLIRMEDFVPEEQVHLNHGADESAAQVWILDMLEGGKLVVPDDWEARVARGEIVVEAVRDWQLRLHPGHAASVVAVFRDGGAMENHAAFESAARTGIPSLAILGELDDLSSEEELKRLGFANTTVIAGAGHGVVRQNVPEVANLIERFWLGECNFSKAHA